VLELAAVLTRLVATQSYDVLSHTNGRKLVALGEAMQARVPLGTSIDRFRGSLPHFQAGGKEEHPLHPSTRPERLETLLKRVLGARPGKESTEARAAAIRFIEEGNPA
jgi:hypothetical protein